MKKKVVKLRIMVWISIISVPENAQNVPESVPENTQMSLKVIVGVPDFIGQGLAAMY